MSRIAIAIPTFRRPEGLARLLDALAELRTSRDVLVVVADNDLDRQEGRLLCERQQRKGYRWPLAICLVAERGISAARNVLIREALNQRDVQFVAMIDDDEWPEKDWLDSLIAVQRDTSADFVGGPSIPHFEVAPPSWISSSGAFQCHRAPTGTINLIESTANVLISLSCISRLQEPWFDPSFGLSGGGDKNLFVHFKSLEATFAWADEAIVHEFVPVSRMTLKWVLARAFRIGNADMRITIKGGGSQIIAEFAKIAAALLLCPIACCLSVLSPGRSVNMLRKLCRAAGKIAALVGYHYREYSVIHGK